MPTTLLMTLALLLGLAWPALASTIDLAGTGSGGSYDAVVHGRNDKYKANKNNTGLPDGRVNWGSTKEPGWLQLGWLEMSGSGDESLDGNYLWVENFNIYDVTGIDPKDGESFALGTDYTVNQVLQLTIADSFGSHNGVNTGGDDFGALTLTGVSFGQSSNYGGTMTLTGFITSAYLGDTPSSFSLTLYDHDSGTNQIMAALNSGRPNQQKVNVEGQVATGTPEPSALLLLGSALGLAVFLRPRRALALVPRRRG